MSESDAFTSSSAAVAERATDFHWDGHQLGPGIGIAVSGGGFRAMLFHAGAFLRLAELGVLQKAQRISSVSGGSITAGWLACQWSALLAAGFTNMRGVFVEPLLAFSRERIDVMDAIKGVLPWTSAAESLAESYDRSLFAGRTLQDLPDAPQFVFCATNLQTGVLWRFTKAYAGDYVVGRIGQPSNALAQAVAASSAFPPVLSPLVLDVPEGSFGDWPEAAASTYAEPQVTELRRGIMLTDGGVYDNHGVEPVIKRFATVFVSDGGAPFSRRAKLDRDWISQLHRILEVTDNQVRALRRRDLIDRFNTGRLVGDEAAVVASAGHGRLGCYWGIDTDPDKLAPPEALPCDAEVVHRLAQVGTRLSDLGEDVSMQLVNWGYAICDRSVRTHCDEQGTHNSPSWPFPEAAHG